MGRQSVARFTRCILQQTSAADERRVEMITAGIVGATGYTGVELLRLLARHPQVEVRAVTSRSDSGTPVAEMFPSLRGAVDLRFSDPAEAGLDRCDIVFFATPNGIAMKDTPALVKAGVRVIDIAADARDLVGDFFREEHR